MSSASAGASDLEMADVIDGIEVETGQEAVWVRSERRLRVLSSAPVGGDLDACRHILNMHVEDGYRAEAPAADLTAFARRLGIAEPFVGLMTAARTHEAAVVTEGLDGTTVAAVVTVGLGSPVSTGRSPQAPWRSSTINIIVLVDGILERTAAVNAVITATEAKVAALAGAGILTADGLPATGTATDAVVVAWTGRGATLAYLGPASLGGWLVGRAVRRAVAQGLERR